jgi:hypothetical protein
LQVVRNQTDVGVWSTLQWVGEGPFLNDVGSGKSGLNSGKLVGGYGLAEVVTKTCSSGLDDTYAALESGFTTSGLDTSLSLASGECRLVSLKTV